MPISRHKDSEGCYYQYGDSGAKYHFPCDNDKAAMAAKKKAIAQAIAIGVTDAFAGTRVSFDYDGVLSTQKGKELALEELKKGNIVYVISARDTAASMYPTTLELGIPIMNVFATGSNSKKIEKILELRIQKHIDNNFDVISKLPAGVGEKF